MDKVLKTAGQAPVKGAERSADAELVERFAAQFDPKGLLPISPDGLRRFVLDAAKALVDAPPRLEVGSYAALTNALKDGPFVLMGHTGLVIAIDDSSVYHPHPSAKKFQILSHAKLDWTSVEQRAKLFGGTEEVTEHFDARAYVAEIDTSGPEWRLTVYGRSYLEEITPLVHRAAKAAGATLSVQLGSEELRCANG